jgi:hypothetical protein
LTLVFSQEFADLLFLNCTKNTELTSRPFPRRVSLALTKRKQQSRPGKTNQAKETRPTGQHRPASCALKLKIQEFEKNKPMKTAEWKTYRTRFLVKAKQLSFSLSFTDSLGRQHSGRKGDYLVESSDGILRIAPRQIFEDIYVSMDASQEGVHDLIAANVSLQPNRKQPQPSHARRSATSGAIAH